MTLELLVSAVAARGIREMIAHLNARDERDYLQDHRNGRVAYRRLEARTCNGDVDCLQGHD